MTERIVTYENPFPADLEGRLNAILNVVNTEMKSLTLLHLDTEHALTGGEIQSRVRRTLNGGGYLVDNSAFFGYCQNSLYPIGMVAKEEILSDGDITLQTGYRLTGAGLHYGLPIAAFSLVFAVNNNLSLYSVLGPTTSPGDSRSPRNRIKIIEALASNEKTTTEFFRESLLDNQSVRNHLIQLRKIGILDFDSSQRLRRRLAVNLTPVGRDFFENYISPIKKALVVGRQLDEMNRRYLMLLMQNPETFTKIAQKATRIYASISPNIRRVDQDKRMEQIYRLLEEKGKMTRRQVAEELRIALNLTTRYLRMMRKSQIIQFEVSECEEKIYSLRSRP